MRLIVLLVILAAILQYNGIIDINTGFLNWRAITTGGSSLDDLPPRPLAEREPVQTRLQHQRRKTFKGYELTKTHSFDIEALVLSRKLYALDVESRISPIDLALGWGPMSNPLPLRNIKITQSERFYHYYYETPPISKQEIARNSANIHMIPANQDVYQELKSLRRGDVVSLSGYLVNVRNPKNGWQWRTSISRTDQGRGACEVFYVEAVHKKHLPY